MKKVLVSHTFLCNPDSEKQFQELVDLEIKEFALFLSMHDRLMREALFKKLEILRDIKIPFAHARSDMTPEEFQYMIEKFGTEKFNLHPDKDKKIEYDLSAYKDRIYIENTGRWIDEHDVEGFGGLCLDLSHLTHAKLSDKKIYDKVIELIGKFKVGCNHISAIGPLHFEKFGNCQRYDYHYLDNMSQLDYLKELPQEYFGEYIAIELGNSIADQLKIKKYIEDIVGL